MSEQHIQALKTLSGQIMGLHSLNDLLEAMLEFVAEYTQPDRLYFIMERKGRLFIVASRLATPNPELRIRGRAVESSNEINFTLATDVAVTKRRQNYQNTLEEERLKKDSVHHNRRQVAVVTEPLLDNGKLQGLFYLEYLDRDFPSKTISFFDHVTPGLTVAMHNTIRTIEAKREHEILRIKLEKASQKPSQVKSADKDMTYDEAYDRAKAASYVLHKLGNVLNAALMLGEEMEEDAEELPPLEKLNTVQALIKENSADITAFLCDDERGRKIPSFLVAAANKLAQEREDYAAQLKKLNALLSEMRELMLYHQDKVNKMD